MNWHKKGTMAIYFIQQQEFIKIGYGRDPYQRLGSLQSASPFKLTMRCIVEGNTKKEAELQEKFGRYNVRGEWFRLVPEIEAFIAENESYVWEPPEKKCSPMTPDLVIAK